MGTTLGILITVLVMIAQAVGYPEWAGLSGWYVAAPVLVGALIDLTLLFTITVFSVRRERREEKL